MFVEGIIRLLKICLDEQAKNQSESINLTNVECFYDYSKRDIVKDMTPFSVSHLWVGKLSNCEYSSGASNAHIDETQA
jgi:hypothetical protein